MNMSIIRGLIKAVRPAKSKGPSRFDAEGRAEEEFSDREMFQQYGFTSCPPKGTQCLLVRSGQNVYMVASDGRDYKIDLKDGEVAISDKNGSVVHLQDGGNILVKSGPNGKVVVESGKIYLGNELAAEAGGGVVTMMCSCAMSGAPHPVNSNTVKAAL